MKTVTLKEQNKILKRNGLPQVAIPKKLPNMPEGAEDIFLVPTWDKVAKTYPEAVQRLWDIHTSLKPTYKWVTIDAAHLKQRAKITTEIFAAQTGEKYKGKSIEEVRREKTYWPQGEFLLGSYETLVMLLTHPDRLTKYEDLWIDCPNDEYSWNGDGSFGRSLYFYFYGGRLKFDYRHVDVVYGRYGSVSAFGPQSTLAPRPAEAFVRLIISNPKLVLEAIESIEDKLKEIKGMIE